MGGGGTEKQRGKIYNVTSTERKTMGQDMNPTTCIKDGFSEEDAYSLVFQVKRAFKQ